MKDNLNTKKQSWINALFLCFFIAIPGILITIFLNKEIVTYIWWRDVLIAIGFLFFISLVSFIFIYFKILNISILIFLIPLSITLMVIFLTSPLIGWVRALISIPFIITIIPTRIFINKIEINKSKKTKNNTFKIIGEKKDDLDK